MKKILVSSSLVIATAIALPTQAEVIDIEYKTKENQIKNTAPNAKFINADGYIKATIIAGVDRKISYQLLGSNGDVLHARTTPILGPNDRVESGGNSYYGVKESISIPSDGTYTLKANVLAADGATLRTYDHELVVDTQQPEIKGGLEVGTWSVYGHTHTDGLRIGANNNMEYIPCVSAWC